MLNALLQALSIKEKSANEAKKKETVIIMIWLSLKYVD